MVQPRLSYWRWFFSRDAGTGQPDANDRFIVLISNDGGASWTAVDTTNGWWNHWEEVVIDVAAHVAPTNQVRVRFVAADLGNVSTVEAAIDDVTAWDAAQAPAHVPETGAALRFGAPRPNPSRGAVALTLDLPASGAVEVELLDVEGRRVRILHQGVAAAGRLALAWDGADESGTLQPAGLYFVRARAAGAEARTRVVRIP
jgi:hypothetical protein